MKKAFLITILIAALAVSACGSESSKNETAQLEEEVAQLQETIDDLQDKLQNSTQGDGAQSTSVPETTGLSQDTVAPETSGLPQDTAASAETVSPDSISADGEQQGTAAADTTMLSASIEELQQRIAGTTPGSSVQEQRDQYYALKGEIDALEHELDYLEEHQEAQYHAGEIEHSAYLEHEHETELLEEQLDRCEDKLEVIFNMVDD